MSHDIIAIDGPAGSGKSTVARRLAARLSVPYLDTGAMYRALTYAAVIGGVKLNDEQKLASLVRKSRIRFVRDAKGLEKVFLNGRDVTDEIRKPDLTEQVHYIAALPAVRKELVSEQRRLAGKSGAIVEGRDIGTVVFPDTPHKFYLDARFDVRVKRRYDETRRRGDQITLRQVSRDQRLRDSRDSGRKVSPLKRAPDAVRIDSTHLTIEQVVGKIASLILADKKARKAPAGRR